VIASAERKSLGDLVSSLMNGKLRFAVAELATLAAALLRPESPDNEADAS
jgi:hypothetical protein